MEHILNNIMERFNWSIKGIHTNGVHANTIDSTIKMVNTFGLSTRSDMHSNIVIVTSIIAWKVSNNFKIRC